MAKTFKGWQYHYRALFTEHNALLTEFMALLTEFMALSVACTGLVDNGEDIEVAAVREVLEETGVHVKFEGVRVCVCIRVCVCVCVFLRRLVFMSSLRVCGMCVCVCVCVCLCVF